MSIRLVPLVVIAISLLLALKLTGLVVNGGMIFAGINSALAQNSKTETDAHEDKGAAATDQKPSAASNTADSAADATRQSPEQTGAEQSAATDQESARPVENLTPINATRSTRDGLIHRLGARRTRLDERARELDLRENLLKAAQQRLQERIRELKAIEARIEDMVKGEGAKKKAQLSGLITMYETMKPKAAAKVFDRLDIDVLVEVVSQMDPIKMAEVLAKMTPEAAEQLTVEIARRSRSNISIVPSSTDSQLPKIGG